MLNFLKRQYIALLLSRSNSQKKASIYRKYFGMSIGKNVRFTCEKLILSSEPFLISIGDNVTITNNVVFHTHDGGAGLFREEYPGINIFGRIIIGNNVFIGSNTILLPGVRIGDNVVVAAGSIVSKDIPNNTVVAGVPAKKIRSFSEYKEKVLKNAIYVFETKDIKRREEILKKIK